MRILAIGLAALALGGCASSAHYTRTGQPGTEEEFQRTLAKCKVQAAMVQDGYVALNTRENCLRAEGWVRD